MIRTSGCSFRASTKNLRRYLVLVLTPGLIEDRLDTSLSGYSGIRRGNRLEYVQMTQRSPSADPARTRPGHFGKELLSRCRTEGRRDP